MRLCLGTVQFGMDYGVQGGTRPSVEDAVAMLDFAVRNGVDAIDTAAAYGTAEEVVGAFLAHGTCPRGQVQIVSKFGTGIFEGLAPEEYPAALKEATARSLKRLGTDYLDAFICHVPSAAGDEAVLAAMSAVKAAGLTRHIGFSVYETAEAQACLASEAVDFMQVPFSLFDPRMKNAGILDAAARRGVEVHTRSAFVQGLLLMPVAQIPPHLASAKPYVEELEALCRAQNVTRRRLALAYVKAQPGISHLVFGVDGMAQLKETVGDFAQDVPADLLEAVSARFVDVPAEIFMPNKWRKGT